MKKTSTEMKKTLTEMVFVLDRSGSMSGLEADTIGGFNSMIEKQRAVEGEAIVTTVLFDHEYEMIHDRFSLENVGPLTEDVYYARGCTALLDAMGSSIQKEINVQKNLPEDKKADKVIFVIITDGEENSSCEYSYSSIRKMIEAQKEKGWEFMFLGANIDAVSEGAKLGISADRAVEFKCDSRGVSMNYDCVGAAVKQMRCMSAEEPMDASWKEDIEEYLKKSE